MLEIQMNHEVFERYEREPLEHLQPQSNVPHNQPETTFIHSYLRIHAQNVS